MTNFYSNDISLVNYAARTAADRAIMEIVHGMFAHGKDAKDRARIARDIFGAVAYWQGSEQYGFEAWEFAFQGRTWRYLPASGPDATGGWYVRMM